MIETEPERAAECQAPSRLRVHVHGIGGAIEIEGQNASRHGTSVVGDQVVLTRSTSATQLEL